MFIHQETSKNRRNLPAKISGGLGFEEVLGTFTLPTNSRDPEGTGSFGDLDRKNPFCGSDERVGEFMRELQSLGLVLR